MSLYSFFGFRSIRIAAKDVLIAVAKATTIIENAVTDWRFNALLITTGPPSTTEDWYR